MLLVNPYPGRCPGLVCHAPLGHPGMPMIWEGEAPQAIKPRLRVTFRPHRSRAGALLLDNSCVSYTAEASRELKACAWPNANDLPKGGTSALKGPRIPAQGHALGLAKSPPGPRSEGTPHISQRAADAGLIHLTAAFLQNARIGCQTNPRALPWAGMPCPVGASRDAHDLGRGGATSDQTASASYFPSPSVTRRCFAPG